VIIVTDFTVFTIKNCVTKSKLTILFQGFDIHGREGISTSWSSTYGKYCHRVKQLQVMFTKHGRNRESKGGMIFETKCHAVIFLYLNICNLLTTFGDVSIKNQVDIV